MIAPKLPGADGLVGKVDYLLVDRMINRHADRIYKACGWAVQITDTYFCDTGRRIAQECGRLDLECRLMIYRCGDCG